MMEGSPAKLFNDRLPPKVPTGTRLAGAEATLARPLRIADLTRAFDNADLLLHYQPQVDVSQRWPKIVGYEALSRWPLLDGSFVPPDRFIPMAESCGLITALDIWVIETACQELARSTAVGAGCRLSMSANVSPQQFAQRQFAQSVADVLTRTGADPTRLTLEITERAVLKEDETTLRNIHALREIGISLALDDFGTGYSSLLLLSSLPIQEIKLDQSFVSRLPHREMDTKIVSATIDLASGLGLRIIAEGVERAAQANWLRQKGCNIIQGFLYGRPAPRLNDRFSAEICAVGSLPSGSGEDATGLTTTTTWRDGTSYRFSDTVMQDDNAPVQVQQSRPRNPPIGQSTRNWAGSNHRELDPPKVQKE